MYYLLNDAVMQCSLFVLAGFLALRYGASTLDELGRVHVRNPWAIVTFVAAGLGMVGLTSHRRLLRQAENPARRLGADNNIAAAAIVLTTLITLGYFAQVFEKLVRAGPKAPPLASRRRHGPCARPWLRSSRQSWDWASGTTTSSRCW